MASRSYFIQVAVPELYKKCTQKDAAELKTVQFYATMTNPWSNRKAEPYQSLTVHCIDQDLHLEARCPLMSYLPDCHTRVRVSSRPERGACQHGSTGRKPDLQNDGQCIKYCDAITTKFVFVRFHLATGM